MAPFWIKKSATRLVSSLQAYLRIALELLSRSSIHALWHCNSLVEGLVSQIQAFEILENHFEDLAINSWLSESGNIKRYYQEVFFLVLSVPDGPSSYFRIFISESCYVKLWKMVIFQVLTYHLITHSRIPEYPNT
jgi:hypothetical protein